MSPSAPADWRGDFPTDPAAPSVGSWGGWGKAFLLRAKRQAGQDGSETIHPTARGNGKPAARIVGRLLEES